MSKAVTEVAIGAAAIGAAFLVPGIGAGLAWVTLGMQNAAIGALAGLGASSITSGIASALQANQGGLAVGVATPIGPWMYVYGTQKVGGVEIFRESNNNTGASGGTSNNKQLHRVYALACHKSALGSWQLRIDGKQVLVHRDFGTANDWVSYSPTQVTCNISTVSRSSGVVTVVLASPMPSGTDGTTLQIRSVADNTFNGTYNVTQPNPADFTTWTYVCGGSNATTSGGNARTTYSDYKDKIRICFLDGTHTATFPTLLAAGTTWGASDLCLGRTLMYLQMGYDDQVFPSSIPNVSVVMDGKNDILDPRTSTRGFTRNAALCIADYLSLPPAQGGFGLVIGTDIPTAQLIAAANICDEAVSLAGGGTISRYTCDTAVGLNQSRGTILHDMLSSCAGRISYQGGQYSIFPGAWVSPTLQLSDGDLSGPISLKSRLPIRDTCNAVKGTYVSPENAYQQADVPAYMQDVAHGYVSDPWLAEDNGERIFKEANFPCTNSSATAQRLEKIALLRDRYQMRLTIRAKLVAFQAVALDVIQLTHPRYSWSNKNFEVLASRFIVDKSGKAPRPYIELDLAETDSSIFDWVTTEQLTPQGYKQPNNVGVRVCAPPENVIAYSGLGGVVNGITVPPTVYVASDGRVINSIYITWTTPNDANVVHGGHLEAQYQKVGDSTWTSLGKVDPSTNYVWVNGGVQDGVSYNVQVRAVNMAGVPSDWVEASPYPLTVNATHALYNIYTVTPLWQIANPTATSITMPAVSVVFNKNTVSYGTRTFTIPTPSVPTWYYITIADATQIGDTPTTLAATCQTSDALVGVAGNTFIGAIQALPGSGGVNQVAGGWPTPRTFSTLPPSTSAPPRPWPSIPHPPRPAY